MSEPIHPTVNDLNVLVITIASAVQAGLMERDHAKGIWKQALTASGYNTPAPAPKLKQDTQIQAKGGDK